MHLLKTLAAAVFLAAPAAAAPVLIYESGGSALVDLPFVDGSFADFFDDGADDLDVSVTGGYAGGLFSADLFISGAGGSLLESSTLESGLATILAPDPSGPTLDRVTLVFGGLSGSEVARFGSTATVVLSFFAEDEVDGFFPLVDAQVFSNLAPVPLPASLPLLAAALVGGATISRRVSRRKQKTRQG